MNTYSIFQTKNLLMIGCLSAVLLLTACEQKGSAEKAGQKIDQATEAVSKKIETATSTVNQKAETVSEYMDDTMITAKVKEALLADDLLKVTQIEVTTVDGVAKLSGSLESEQLVARAVDLVKNQKNVKSVQNDLLLKPDMVAK